VIVSTFVKTDLKTNPKLVSDREIEPLFPVVEMEISLSVAVGQKPDQPGFNSISSNVILRTPVIW